MQFDYVFIKRGNLGRYRGAQREDCEKTQGEPHGKMKAEIRIMLL